ncbi:FAD-dependent oxidoreductase [Gemmatimonas phototrophica]|uniref:FAD-dependent oxidoreductase n=1 Tax=Gemmatimonas phototrophica TaxID=1379270 RepID=A0A145Q5F8_9BACT|nr:FAD-dependent oxidoreductase [Gemmatimonas phototrophica]
MAPACVRGRLTPAAESTADLVIVGGGLGGCAAALAALQRGLRVIMTEETDWIGGQLTQQAVPPDENAWIESIGGTRSYLALRDAIRSYYRTQTPLTAAARANPRLNPGNGWVSRLCCEPRVSLGVLEAQFAPYVASGQLRLLLQHVARQVQVQGDRILGVEVRSLLDGERRWLTAPFYADATELGDLLPMSGTEYVTGAESRAMTGEPHAKDVAEPDNVQAFTVCFAMEHRDGEDHVGDRPAAYETWRNTMVQVPGSDTPTRLLSFDDPGSARLGFNPVARTGYWSYRRIIDRTQFVPGTHASDVTIVNWGQNDYSFGSLIDVSPQEAAQHVSRAKELGVSLLYWLQTECPRPDGGAGWRGLRLRHDVMGTTDGFAKYPYIRESRRIRARFTVCEQHVTLDARLRETGASREAVTAAPFADSVGIGHYSMDLHLTTRGDRGQYGATLPFQIPLGALLPERMENVLPVCKNIGVTHLTNGCYRLHPIEWNIGESAGHLVAYCLAQRTTPHAVHAQAAHIEALQRQLITAGVPLAWPHPLPK